MPKLNSDILTHFATEIFAASRVPKAIAKEVSKSLVLANLSGHESHGVIRIIEYVEWIERGWVNPRGKLTVEHEQSCILQLDGGYQFGQVIGREAMALGIAKANNEGVCVVSLKRSAHLGRVGELMEQVASAGLVCFAFTNTHGAGVLVAPHGGCQRRLSANPLVAGAPLNEGPDFVMDVSTSTIAEGKIKVARSKGESLPPGLFVNGNGDLATNPEEYYADPPGALLPVGGHKGFALSMCCEIMAGALTGAGCSKPDVERIANGFMAFILNPQVFAGTDFVSKELAQLVRWVKSSRVQSGVDRIQTPGEPEAYARSANGSDVAIDGNTWDRICGIAKNAELPSPTLRPINITCHTEELLRMNRCSLRPTVLAPAGHRILFSHERGAPGASLSTMV